MAELTMEYLRDKYKRMDMAEARKLGRRRSAPEVFHSIPDISDELAAKYGEIATRLHMNTYNVAPKNWKKWYWNEK